MDYGMEGFDFSGERFLNRAAKAQIATIVRFMCAASAPPNVHIPAGTRRTHFTSKLKEPRSRIIIILAGNACAWHFRDVT